MCAKYNITTNATITGKIFGEYWSSRFGGEQVKNGNCVRVHVVRRILSNISGILVLFSQSFHRMKAFLCTDDGSVLFFSKFGQLPSIILEFTLLKRAIFAAMHPQF